MLRFLKRFGWLALLVFGLQSVHGFSLLGPNNEAWQTPTIGYNLPGVDIGTPKMIGQEYRWNTPVNYYGFDETFLSFFGSNGIVAIDQAFGVLNALTNTPFSALDVNQFPLGAYRVNPLAQSLNLRDLKSVALRFVMEEQGLTEPDRFVWTLRNREPQPGASCPAMIYWVIQRNYDPVTFEPSAYVNGVLYSYIIREICTGGDPLAVTFNFPVDPTAPLGTAVMSENQVLRGAYVVGLSRDDVGALRYLMRSNNVNWESISSDSVEYVTNTVPQLLFTSNLTDLASQSITNDAATLANLFPGLVIASTTNFFTNVWVTNITAYLTNYPYDPIDALPHLVIATNRQFTIQTWYHHTFGNVYTFSNTPTGWVPVPLTTAPTTPSRTRVALQTIAVTNPPWMPVDSPPRVQTSLKRYTTNMIMGEYVILPTNSCAMGILGLQATLTNYYTNFIISITNILTVTNSLGGGGATTNSVENSLITFSTNHVFVYLPVQCAGTNSTLRGGIDTISFHQASYDSLVGRFFQPITNIYHMPVITNSVSYMGTFQRVITQPDYVFATVDMAEFLLTRTTTDGNFISSTVSSNAGPGNIEPRMTITFNRIAPYWVNVQNPNLINEGLSEDGARRNFAWASFDGSTNDPVVYPSGTSIRDLENMILFSIVTTDLPDAAVGVPYLAQLQAAGGQLPYAWAPTADSAPLPPGLTLSADGTISGMPTTEGTYTFSVIVTEAGARASARTFTITVTPP